MKNAQQMNEYYEQKKLDREERARISIRRQVLKTYKYVYKQLRADSSGVIRPDYFVPEEILERLKTKGYHVRFIDFPALRPPRYNVLQISTKEDTYNYGSINKKAKAKANPTPQWYMSSLYSKLQAKEQRAERNKERAFSLVNFHPELKDPQLKEYYYEVRKTDE